MMLIYLSRADSEKVHVSVFYSEKSAIIIRNYLCFVVITPFILIEVEDVAPRLRTAYLVRIINWLICACAS